MSGAVGYIRVSTTEQAESGVGLIAQRQAIEVECERRGWGLVAMEADEGVSGKSVKKRDALARALCRLDKGEADVLVVTKLDRLSRSVIDFAVLMERASKKGWRIVVLDLGVDTTTANGELVAGILVQVAQWERKLIGQRTKDALAVKKAQGVRLGRPTTLPTDVVTLIDTMRATGSTLQAIADSLNSARVPTAQGGKQWYPGTVRKVLARAANGAAAQDHNHGVPGVPPSGNHRPVPPVPDATEPVRRRRQHLTEPGWVPM